MLDILESDVFPQRLEFRAEFADDFLEQFGIENAACFRKGAQGNTWASEYSLDFGQFTGLLDASERGDDRIEQEKRVQHAVLIEVQAAIARLIALAAGGPSTARPCPLADFVIE